MIFGGAKVFLFVGSGLFFFCRRPVLPGFADLRPGSEAVL
jgi:hypothetical protein